MRKFHKWPIQIILQQRRYNKQLFVTYFNGTQIVVRLLKQDVQLTFDDNAKYIDSYYLQYKCKINKYVNTRNETKK